MCGIVGYLGKSKKAKFVVNKLKKLEYRGYDSAGIAMLNNNEVVTYKAIGKIDNLLNKIPDDADTCEAIAHTRWATNGVANLKNAHPHSSKNNVWTIVHNGIIENDKEIMEKLKFIPESDTDTSVLAEYFEEKNVQNIFDFIDVFHEVKGSYAILAEYIKDANSLFVAKNRNPIFISFNDDGDFLIASDPICFVDFSDKYYSLNDYEFAYIHNGKVEFYSINKEVISKEIICLDNIFEAGDKMGYDHYMIKEIFEQSDALKRQINTYKDKKILEKFDKDFIKKFKMIKLIGCGTAYHAGLMGAKYIQKILNIPATAEIASEFIYSLPIFADSETLFIFVSQSGETADTIKAMDMAKEKGATTIALTNVLYSTLANKTDYILPVCAGPEIAVASTKAYVCQISALYLFASYFSDSVNYYDDIEHVSDKILNFDREKIDRIAEIISKQKECIFIGKDIDYITACEASLKLKEIGYINSSNYPSGELKHGFLALVEKGTFIFVFANQKNINQKTFNAANEAKSRGAEEIIFTNEVALKDGNSVVFINEENELLIPMLSIVPAQYLAYKVSILKGINPDQPRNLAKSVTVE